MHPDHRNLLQRLIRARGQSRALRELSAPDDAASTPRPDPTSATPPAIPATPAATPAEMPASGRSLALVIGNEQYTDFTRLRTPAADAQAIAAVLGHDYGFEVTVLTNATRYQIVSALSQLRRTATE